MTLFPWVLILVIFAQPVYYLGRSVYGKINGKEDDFVQNWANFKSWCLRMWDLLKWRVT